MSLNQKFLAHHGIKGQRWGVRRTPEQLGHKTGGLMDKFKAKNKPDSIYADKETCKRVSNAVSGNKGLSNALKAFNDTNDARIKLRDRLQKETKMNAKLYYSNENNAKLLELNKKVIPQALKVEEELSKAIDNGEFSNINRLDDYIRDSLPSYEKLGIDSKTATKRETELQIATAYDAVTKNAHMHSAIVNAQAELDARNDRLVPGGDD